VLISTFFYLDGQVAMNKVPSYLKSSIVKINDIDVPIHQLSGLDRFEFTEFVSHIDYPPELKEPSGDAPIEEKGAYLKEGPKLVARWNKINFQTQSRLVAYGIKTHDEDIDKKHQWVMRSFAQDDVSMLHLEIAKLSGMYIEKKESDDTEKVDPIDPKQK
jgi:hypothetical protein